MDEIRPSLCQRVGQFAFYSRILVLVMQAFFNALMPDHNADAFKPINVHRHNSLDRVVEYVFEGVHRWDAMYFQHIAEYGYTYENTMAFFPLFPLTVRLLANSLLFPLQYLLNYANVLLLAAVILNFVLFVKSAKALYELGVKVLGNETLAFKAAQLYCINPASVFFTACYSETMFAYLTFSGMLALQQYHSTVAALWFAFSGLCRSNGLVNFGFIAYFKLCQCLNRLIAIQKGNVHSYGALMMSVVTVGVQSVGTLLASAAICVTPFLLYQAYAYNLFCRTNPSPLEMPGHLLNFGNSQGLRMAYMGRSDWCFWNLPISYLYIQDKYWDVGFMRYFVYKQIPNFLLAAPMVILCVMTVGYFVVKNFVCFFSLGLARQDFYKKFDEEKSDDENEAIGLANPNCFVYVVHLIFLTVFSFFCMHVQVTTRFICSSSPAVYWFIATMSTTADQLKTAPRVYHYDVFHSSHNHENGQANVAPSITEDYFDWDSRSWFNKTVFAYFHLYFFVGIAAFSNFLPWT